MPSMTSNFISDISRLTGATNGRSRSRLWAWSVAPMTVIRPARISKVLEAKKEVLRSRLLIRLASAMRCSRSSSRAIQSLRYRCSTLARQGVSRPRCQA